MAVHAAVRDEADEVQRVAGAGAAVERRAERRVVEEAAVANAAIDPRQVLIDDPPRADVHVPDLGVAHLAGRQPDGLAARVERGVRVPGGELAVRGRGRPRYRVVVGGRAQTPPVEHDQHKGRRRVRHQAKIAR